MKTAQEAFAEKSGLGSPSILQEILAEMTEATRKLMDHPKYLYLGISQYARLITYARSNLKMFVAHSAEEWGKEMFLNREIIRVDKYSWLKVGP